VRIFSNMRRQGRIGVFVEAITKFLVNLKRHHRICSNRSTGLYSSGISPAQGQGVFSMG
jgi:hypothetical protein